MRNIFIISIVLVSYTTWCWNIFAASPKLEDQQAVQTLQKYAQNLNKVMLEFVQQDSKQPPAHGILVIDKPYKFRCNYFAPFPLLIVGNKNYVSIYDFEMEHLSRVNASENPFYFLLIDQVDFTKQFKIIATELVNNHHVFTLEHLSTGKISKIWFDQDKKSFTRLEILEINNQISIEIQRITHLASAKPDLFLLRNPNVFGKPAQLDRTALLKLLTPK